MATNRCFRVRKRSVSILRLTEIESDVYFYSKLGLGNLFFSQYWNPTKIFKEHHRITLVKKCKNVCKKTLNPSYAPLKPKWQKYGILKIIVNLHKMSLMMLMMVVLSPREMDGHSDGWRNGATGLSEFKKTSSLIKTESVSLSNQ